MAEAGRPMEHRAHAHSPRRSASSVSAAATGAAAGRGRRVLVGTWKKWLPRSRKPSRRSLASTSPPQCTRERG